MGEPGRGRPSSGTHSGQQAVPSRAIACTGYTLSVPALNTVQPILVGPITDLLTFYADGQLSMRQKGLVRTSDHVFYRHGTPNSWADGTYTIFGEDSVDFDMTLSSVDQAAHTATLVVRHIPPTETRLPFPAAWMATPVTGTVNNWAQVEKSGGGKYLAEVGNETFEVTFVLSLTSGRIVKATMDNPTEVLERTCDDAALAVCSPPIRYTIRSSIELVAIDAGSDGSPTNRDAHESHAIVGGPASEWSRPAFQAIRVVSP